MTTVPITLRVGPDTAKIYEAMTEEDRNKITAFLTLQLKGWFVSTGITLRQAMDDVRQEAERNGLTPEILESILRGEGEEAEEGTG
jgi:hypothetical protein